MVEFQVVELTAAVAAEVLQLARQMEGQVYHLYLVLGVLAVPVRAQVEKELILLAQIQQLLVLPPAAVAAEEHLLQILYQPMEQLDWL
jgi:hypothetical protein